MSTKTVVGVALFAAVVLGLCGIAGGNQMALGDGAVIGDAGQPRDIQETIWFQGFVGDAGTGEPVNAAYAVTVRMYDSEVGGLSLWGPETHLGTIITDGWFNVELGSIVGGLPAFDDPPYYLQVTIAGELLSPRLKLASVPSAFQSLGADDGLNLPWSGTFGGSGDAFSVTNTGPNSAGYFRVNNAASSATAVYGNHNGTGAALLGWHTGSGPALRAVANGSGYAGKFEGAVVVEDSMRVEGQTVMQGNAVVTDTLLAIEGFWFPQGAESGYVLRSADDWGNAEWAPPNVVDISKYAGGPASLETGAVVNPSGAVVSLTVPGSGHIVVESQVWIVFDHTSGTADKIYLAHSESPTSFTAPLTERFFWEIPAAYGTESDLDRTFHVANSFDVGSAGTYTYYFVADMSAGFNAGDYIIYVQTTAIHYPHPVPVMKVTDTEIVYPESGDAAMR